MDFWQKQYSVTGQLVHKKEYYIEYYQILFWTYKVTTGWIRSIRFLLRLRDLI